MLKEMSVHDWHHWQIYMQLAPFGEERADIRSAQICQMIVNMQRDTKEHPEPIPLEKFLLKFGDAQTASPKINKKQTIEEQERNLIDWVAGSNRAFAEVRGA